MDNETLPMRALTAYVLKGGPVSLCSGKSAECNVAESQKVLSWQEPTPPLSGQEESKGVSIRPLDETDAALVPVFGFRDPIYTL